MESAPNCYDHTDDLNIGKMIILKLLSIIHMNV
jgi:hypothetical protein